MYVIGGFIHVAVDLLNPSISNERFTPKMSNNKHSPPNMEHIALSATAIIIWWPLPPSSCIGKTEVRADSSSLLLYPKH